MISRKRRAASTRRSHSSTLPQRPKHSTSSPVHPSTPDGKSERLYNSSLGNRSIPFADFRSSSISNPNEHFSPLPRSSITTSLPRRKEVPITRFTEVPVFFTDPPIKAEADQHADSSKQEGDSAKTDELKKMVIGLTADELRRMYQEYVQRYQLSKDQFEKLQKRREKTLYALDQLRFQVKELTEEQALVEEEFERLNLGTPKSKSKSA